MVGVEAWPAVFAVIQLRKAAQGNSTSLRACIVKDVSHYLGSFASVLVLNLVCVILTQSA